MKKLLAILLAAVMLLSVVACTNGGNDVEDPNTDPDIENPDNTDDENTDPDNTPDGGEDNDPAADANVTIKPTVEEGTLGATMWEAFMQAVLANESVTMEELANTLVTNPAIQFFGGAVPVEAGLLSGFDNYEVTGFTSGAMFAPMMGSIAFVGYVFELAEDADVQAFVNELSANANPRWQICVTADQTVVGAFNNKVFFLMCPTSLGGGEAGGEMGGEVADIYYPLVDDATVGCDLWNVFEATMTNGTATTAQEIAQAIVDAQMVPYALGAMAVEPGLLSGFDNYEVGGFTEGAVFMPMIGSIPFVGYIFQVEEGIDVVNYVTDLENNCNPAWNVCVEADQVVAGAYGNTVFFLMCPASIEG